MVVSREQLTKENQGEMPVDSRIVPAIVDEKANVPKNEDNSNITPSQQGHQSKNK